MLVLLLGPKGSGKTHIGRILERELGVHFLHVEPLWMRYNAQCRAAGREPDVPEGVRTVHPAVAEALADRTHVCVETTGASSEILSDLMSLAPETETVVVRVFAPLELCLERIAYRDPAHQISMDVDGIKRVYDLSLQVEVDAAVVLHNERLSDTEIASSLASALALGSSSPAERGYAVRS